ncbi:MAG TPA: hypothetical protein VJJ47_03235 [Candidatus Paceibacterota bacterium]
MGRKLFGFGGVARYVSGKAERLRAAPHHVQRTAAAAAAAAATAAVVGAALLLQATVGSPSQPQLAAPAAAPSLVDAALELSDQLRWPAETAPAESY